ncbi:hypothetical protein HK102_004903 [Quaeritorhiza haematococci]|nr:hypothetical protein HK102_004903 [Quaeritorhiza haematococci]
MVAVVKAVSDGARVIEIVFDDKDPLGKLTGCSEATPIDQPQFINLIREAILATLLRDGELKGNRDQYTVDVQVPDDANGNKTVKEFVESGSVLFFNVSRNGKRIPLTTLERNASEQKLRAEILISQLQQTAPAAEELTKLSPAELRTHCNSQAQTIEVLKNDRRKYESEMEELKQNVHQLGKEYRQLAKKHDQLAEEHSQIQKEHSQLRKEHGELARKHKIHCDKSSQEIEALKHNNSKLSDLLKDIATTLEGMGSKIRSSLET